jgi:PHS family inorganic phosphate transporter-like MFS transporter
MAAVFLMQPVGQLAASLVGLILLLTYGRSNGLETMTDKVQAATIIDTIWRWVVGVGAIPAVIAIIFRLTIPESPRYTLDVDNDGARALRDTRDYYNIGDMDTRYSATYDMEDFDNGNGTGNGITAVPPAAHRPKPGETDTHSMEIIEMESHNRSEQNSDIDPYETGAGDATDDKPHPFSWNELKQYFWVERNIKYLLGTSICWLILDFAFYGLGINNPRTIAHIWASEPQPTRSGDVLSWANPSEPELSIYEVLKQDGIRSIITVSVGSLIGSVILIKVINYVPRRSWLVWSFVGMAVLFAVIGASFFKVVDTELHALTITLYILCQILFNLGPNTLTFIVSRPPSFPPPFLTFISISFPNTLSLKHNFLTSPSPLIDPRRNLPNPLPRHLPRDLRRLRQTGLGDRAILPRQYPHQRPQLDVAGLASHRIYAADGTWCVGGLGVDP